MKLNKKWTLIKVSTTETAELIEFLKDNYEIGNEALVNTYAATIELVSNVFEHAYPKDHVYKSERTCEIRLYTADDDTVKISVIDSGITIPQSIFDKIVSSVQRDISLKGESDSALIEAAVDGGADRSKPWRGKGLAFILETAQRGIFASFSITSRHGYFSHACLSGNTVRDTDVSFDGTSISFSIASCTRLSGRLPNIEISIAKDFSETPGGRFVSDGPNSGEEFSMKIENALSEAEIVTITLDGPLGYASSFLEEAFGGLVRRGYSSSELKLRLKLVSQNKIYTSRIFHFIDTASENNG
ncbi:DUF4325 domain-containing protein [Paraburkholderia sp. BL9I2N2]|uniref:STAS-like domain-containing protein n=1 Tax=Paraburkholderia sp. BL9I2N2 TaxID=1938809 RepID=UPI0010D4CD24|nr:DUF4325 domain-containing protein [Paraburkholderia sp. BL9I2N2]TCK96233.1 uncharacterized protein DUF4325 [Paraburkholderia sp. BL9I2N2]